MSRCRASCVSSRVSVGKTIDLLGPAAMVPQAYGAVLLLASSGHGVGAGPTHGPLS
jgi:hypothetical protein